MTRRSLAKSLAVRSDRGHVVTPAPAFGTGFLQQKADGLAPVSDTAVIEAALSILAKRIARGSVMSSPQAVKEFLTLRLSDLQHEIFGVMLLTLCGAVSYVQMSDPSPEIPKDRPRIDPHKRRLAPPAGYRSDRRRAPAVHVP